MRLEGEREKVGSNLVGDKPQGDWAIRGSGHQDAERAIARADGRKTERGGPNDVSSWRQSAPPRGSQRLSPQWRGEGDSDPQ